MPPRPQLHWTYSRVESATSLLTERHVCTVTRTVPLDRSGNVIGTLPLWSAVVLSTDTDTPSVVFIAASPDRAQAIADCENAVRGYSLARERDPIP